MAPGGKIFVNGYWRLETTQTPIPPGTPKLRKIKYRPEYDEPPKPKKKPARRKKATTKRKTAATRAAAAPRKKVKALPKPKRRGLFGLW